MYFSKLQTLHQQLFWFIYPDFLVWDPELHLFKTGKNRWKCAPVVLLLTTILVWLVFDLLPSNLSLITTPSEPKINTSNFLIYLCLPYIATNFILTVFVNQELEESFNSALIWSRSLVYRDCKFNLMCSSF